MKDLSIVIPARNEMFLAKTVEDILEHIEGNTEVIVVLDGEWANPPLPVDNRLRVIYNNSSIGQRAATNQGVKISNAKYIMKTDAHCSFDKGFDVKMMADMRDDWTMVPNMKNLHAFDWVCTKCNYRKYQGPTPESCPNCGAVREDFKRDIVWIAKPSPNSTSYRFDTTLHFQYFGEMKKRPEGQEDLSETMSLQGSCFMVTRDKYWELNLCDEDFGSWGQQGVEVAVKTWLSGGKVICNHKTWYAHMFRTQGGDFGFPYPLSGSQVERARNYSRELFFYNKWPKQKYPLSWLIEKFRPVPDWHDEKGKEKLDLVDREGELFYARKSGGKDKVEVAVRPPKIDFKGDEPTKGIIYYTDNQLKLRIAHAVQDQLRKISEERGIPIISTSLKPMPHFGRNTYIPLERGVLTMFKQILTALKESYTDIVYFCEADVLYHPSHFDFTPEKKDTFYYNENVWKIDYNTGKALHYDCRQVSSIAVYRELALKHYEKRVHMVEQIGFSMKMGYEPGTHHRPERVDDAKAESWKSAYPILDIRHDNNFSPTRWKKEEFRNQKYTTGWQEGDLSSIKGWIPQQLNFIGK